MAAMLLDCRRLFQSPSIQVPVSAQADVVDQVPRGIRLEATRLTDARDASTNVVPRAAMPRLSASMAGVIIAGAVVGVTMVADTVVAAVLAAAADTTAEKRWKADDSGRRSISMSLLDRSKFVLPVIIDIVRYGKTVPTTSSRHSDAEEEGSYARKIAGYEPE